MRIEFLYWEDCPSHEEALRRLHQVMREEELTETVEITRIDTVDDVRRHQFPGSPTIRVNGQDIQPEGARESAGLSCRTYIIEPGRLSPLPTAEMIRQALRRARQAEHPGGG